MRPRSRNPKRNVVAVRFPDASQEALVEAAGKQRVSPWVREAAEEKLRALGKLPPAPEAGGGTE